MVHDLIIQPNRVGGWSMYDPDAVVGNNPLTGLVCSVDLRHGPGSLVEYAINYLESPVRVVPEPVLFIE